MAITFPASPTNGQTFTSGNKTWQWDGTTWLAYGASLSPSVLKVDAANARVGVNNQSPAHPLDVIGRVETRAAATQDGVALVGRAGGSSSFDVALTPTTLTADRTLTLPNVSGTVITTGDTGTVTNTMLAGSIANSKTTATSANTVSAIVARDASGNFTAGTITAALTGNASTATNLSTDRTNWSTNGTISATVGQLAWKNYGNSHTIFDASNSTSPNGGAVNNTNAAIAWTATYPTLMGWNGGNTYGVRVDSARIADIASSVGTLSSLTVSGTLTQAGNTSLSANNTYQCAALPAFGFNAWAGVSSYNFYNASDIRYKANVQQLPLGLDFIKLLNPIEFTYIYPEFAEDSDTPTSTTEGTRLRAGLSAQNVKESLNAIGAGDYNLWALADKNNPDSFQALDYTGFVAPIIKAIQELDARLQQLETA